MMDMEECRKGYRPMTAHKMPDTAIVEKCVRAQELQYADFCITASHSLVRSHAFSWYIGTVDETGFL